jgi:hypothetical protein
LRSQTSTRQPDLLRTAAATREFIPLPIITASKFSLEVMSEIYCGYCLVVNNHEKIAYVKNSYNRLRDKWA